MVELLRHRQTKEAGTDMFDPKATASHLDSTIRVTLAVGPSFPVFPSKRTSLGTVAMSQMGR
jgi:hypothetical protein